MPLSLRSEPKPEAKKISPSEVSAFCASCAETGLSEIIIEENEVPNYANILSLNPRLWEHQHLTI